MPDYLSTVERDFTAHEMTVLAESIDPVRENALYLSNFDLEPDEEDLLDDQYERRHEAAADANRDWIERYAMTSRASG